uniref:J domain-containing protein n=1 Tax=viral metagenome TaxID=1070528 RepID=A0A6C0DCX9_9ZZZZ
MTTPIKTHNLNIHMYKLNEILDLFGLSYDINIEDLKRAKKIVLMTHPDKSNLSPDYFLFYKKAFDIIVQFYENQTKQNRPIPKEEIKYQNVNPSGYDKTSSNKIRNTINEMPTNEFQQRFNQLFEENMSSKPDVAKNDWFTKDENIYKVPENVNSKNIDQVFQRFKEENSNTVLSKYRGVESMNAHCGTGYYDEEDNDQYVACDVFSKLKFDDLRKVHKDQTIFAVSEIDYQKVPQFSSVDHYVRERSKVSMTPLEKEQAELLLSEQERQYRETIMKKEHAAKLKSMEYEQKNKTVLGNFMRLGY